MCKLSYSTIVFHYRKYSFIEKRFQRNMFLMCTSFHFSVCFLLCLIATICCTRSIGARFWVYTYRYAKYIYEYMVKVNAKTSKCTFVQTNGQLYALARFDDWAMLLYKRCERDEDFLDFYKYKYVHRKVHLIVIRRALMRIYRYLYLCGNRRYCVWNGSAFFRRLCAHFHTTLTLYYLLNAHHQHHLRLMFELGGASLYTISR